MYLDCTSYCIIKSTRKFFDLLQLRYYVWEFKMDLQVSMQRNTSPVETLI